MTDPVTDQAWTLIDNGRPADALRLTAGPAALPQASPGLLMAHAAALKASGRAEEALAFNRRAVARAPADRFAWYNLAATLGDLSLDDEADQAARKTIALGLDVPEVRLVLGKALQGLRRYDEAEATFQRALAARPGDATVHLNLAQLRWMRTGDLGAALAMLDEAIARHPADAGLCAIRSNVQTFAGDHAGADATLEDALARAPGDLALQIAAARTAGAVDDRARMLAHAREAVRLAPTALESHTVLCEALLAQGQADAAAQTGEALVAAAPDDQYALVLRNTAWRLTGDRRGDLFRDYAALVRTDKLETPAGWDSLEAFLDALRDRMLELHDLKTHPLNQSLRGGSQVPSLDRSRDPLVQAFFASARKAVARYVEALGAGEDAIRRRRASDFAFAGGWSVRLRSEGFHADHVHPRGWISSAFYLDLPGRFDDETTRAGWLRFGRPGCLTEPALEAEHFVKPERGTLALFPSCLWHGTQPFTDADHRLTIAFDVVPR
jgi:tetratricopeptide (TPR) repeat protein